MGGEIIMRKILLLAVLAVLVVVPAFASVQNVKVSGDIDTTWIVRQKFDLGQNAVAAQYRQNLGITQARLRVDADLTDNVSTTIRLLNERAWGADLAAGSTSEDVELNLAYVTLKEMLYSPLTVTIGRQEFKFGNSFVIDSAGPNNVITSGGLNGVAEDLSKRIAKDAVRMTLDYNPLTIDLIAAKINSNNNTGTGDTTGLKDDVNLFGGNANYQLGDSMNTVVEGYFWSKIDDSANLVTDPGFKADTVYMPGMHISANVLDGLNLSGEAAWQFGNKTQTGLATGTTTAGPNANIPRNAFGTQLIANYKVPLEATKAYSPVLTGAYTYVSGDSGVGSGKNPTDDNERFEGWDPMFENQSGGTIYNTLFDLTDCHIGTIRGSIKPMEDLTAILEWDGLWLAKDLRDTTNPDKGTSTVFSMRQPGAANLTPTMTSNRKLGDEWDAKLVYDYTEDVQLGAMMGYFRPGGAFDESNKEGAYQYLLNAKVNF